MVIFPGCDFIDTDQLLAMSEEGAAPCQRGNDEYEELAKRFDRLTLRGAERSRRADPHYYEGNYFLTTKMNSDLYMIF